MILSTSALSIAAARLHSDNNSFWARNSSDWRLGRTASLCDRADRIFTMGSRTPAGTWVRSLIQSEEPLPVSIDLWCVSSLRYRAGEYGEPSNRTCSLRCPTHRLKKRRGLPCKVPPFSSNHPQQSSLQCQEAKPQPPTALSLP